MKKFLAMLLAACMVLSLAACGSKEEPKQDDQQGGAQDTQEAQFDENGYMKMDESYLAMAAGSAGGGWYVMGAAMNDLFERNMNVHMTLIPGGGSTNPTLVNEASPTSQTPPLRRRASTTMTAPSAKTSRRLPA